MATIPNTYSPEYFRVIHPLDDAPEQKCSSEGLGHIAMTPSVLVSLTVLRGYLIVMTLMLGYHVLDLAGVLHGSAKEDETFAICMNGIGTITFTLHRLSALFMGAAVGLERQWRQRMAGTRTNALVSAGAAAFVSLIAERAG